jgi:hypothetical protein
MAGGPTTPQQMAGIWATAVTRLSSGAAKPRVVEPSGPDPSGHEPSALAAAKRHRAELLETVQRFGRALSVPTTDPHWRERVRERLDSLRAAVAEHVVVTEGPDGLYAELLDHAPRLARGVHSLVREHAALVTAADTLDARLDEQAIAVEQVRGWASDLLRELHQHRQRGADLVYEAYAADIGGET